jgi:hypothetical protein
MIGRIFGLMVFLCSMCLVLPTPAFAHGRGMHDCDSNAREGQACSYNNQTSFARNQRGVCKRDSRLNDRHCPSGNWLDQSPDAPRCVVRMQTSRMYCEVNR